MPAVGRAPVEGIYRPIESRMRKAPGRRPAWRSPGAALVSATLRDRRAEAADTPPGELRACLTPRRRGRPEPERAGGRRAAGRDIAR
jgi:hypothetical protein